MLRSRVRRNRPTRPGVAQGGATFAGFLVGVVCGLLIAMFAAIMVSRSPVPFINKAGRSPERLTVPKPGQPVPDPNQPLYSKDRKPPAAAPSAETGQPPMQAEGVSILERLFGRSAPDTPPAPIASAPGTAAPAQAPVQPATPGVPGAQPAPAAAPPDPKGDASADDPSRAAQVPPAFDAVAGYVLQAAAFGSREDADTMRVKLALLGFEAKVLPAEVNGQTVYRVRIGPYVQAEEMNRMRSRLA
ncbi:MAG: SPOR domain-containing protein, partial [Quisquiliibacterium sp.]